MGRDFYKRDLSSFQKELLHEEEMRTRIAEPEVEHKEKEKKIDKKYLIIPTFLLFAVIFGVVAKTSYAFFTSQVESKDYVVLAGTLAVDLTESGNVIDLTAVSPMTNAQGIASTNNSYSFTITNNGDMEGKYQLRLELFDNNSVIPLEYIKMAYTTDGTNYSEPVKLSDLNSNLVFVDAKTIVKDEVDSYTLKFWIDYGAPNEIEGKTFRARVAADAVQILDNSGGIPVDTAPIITLNKDIDGNIDQVIRVGSTYNDPGVFGIVDDNEILDITNIRKTYKYFDGSNLTTVDNIDTSTGGIYYITYEITDGAGNIGKTERVVTVNPSTPPTITLVGDNPLTINQRQVFTDPGVTVAEGNKVVTLGEVKTKAAGVYVVRYVVIDSNNNMNSVTRTITVLESSCAYVENQQFNFEYTGAVQTFEPECNGRYKLEVWGAQGGDGYSGGNLFYGGHGGYSVGTITLDANTNLYIYSGGKGLTPNSTTQILGGFNGGGSSYGRSGYTTWGPGSGGGASDIRIGTDSLYARVIVAGGGGGHCYGQGSSMPTNYDITYSYGGGTTGGSGYSGGAGGTQTSGYAFGVGGSGTSDGYGGAGGGWYGGYINSSTWYGTGGGSGYVYTSSTAANYPSGCLLNSSYYLTNASTVAGNTSFISPTGTNETGHTGNGYARITYLGN